MAKKPKQTREEIEEAIRKSNEAVDQRLRDIKRWEREREIGRDHRERLGIPHSAEGMYGWD